MADWMTPAELREVAGKLERIAVREGRGHPVEDSTLFATAANRLRARAIGTERAQQRRPAVGHSVSTGTRRD